MRRNTAEQAAARDLVVGRQRQPRGEMFFAGPAAHVSADFGDQLQRTINADVIGMRTTRLSVALLEHVQAHRKLGDCLIRAIANRLGLRVKTFDTGMPR